MSIASGVVSEFVAVDLLFKAVEPQHKCLHLPLEMEEARFGMPILVFVVLDGYLGSASTESNRLFSFKDSFICHQNLFFRSTILRTVVQV